jgi:gamma-glutamyl:cysteine ligase YbdK (ATP-grasp superfamily)
MKSYHLFDVFGVEVEYMLVDRDTLAVRPETDLLLAAQAGATVSEVEVGDMTWSNELVLHLVELKVSSPAQKLDGVAGRFFQSVQQINEMLKESNACLMPTGAHPWINPAKDTRLWPHEGEEIYREFDCIFGCRTHGWTNVQSMHLNLPFADDREFGRLHAAIRLLLPILPALTASTPILDGEITGLMDSRLEAYRTNAQHVPSVSGRVIPEAIFHIDQYQSAILEHLYEEIAPYDTNGILRYEWLNARGAIARFERNTIEIRVMDTQECPSADLAVANAVVLVLKALVEEEWSSLQNQMSWGVEPLRRIMMDVIRDADQAVITDTAYLELMGYSMGAPCTAAELWKDLLDRTMTVDHSSHSILRAILKHGPLARRILRAAGEAPDRAALTRVYRRLCKCLAEDQFFYP